MYDSTLTVTRSGETIQIRVENDPILTLDTQAARWLVEKLEAADGRS